MTRYVCKTCGAEAPPGIGYAAGDPAGFREPDPGCEGPHLEGDDQ